MYPLQTIKLVKMDNITYILLNYQLFYYIILCYLYFIIKIKIIYFLNLLLFSYLLMQYYLIFINIFYLNHLIFIIFILLKLDFYFIKYLIVNIKFPQIIIQYLIFQIIKKIIILFNQYFMYLLISLLNLMLMFFLKLKINIYLNIIHH